jgi:hypothetical protein
MMVQPPMKNGTTPKRRILYDFDFASKQVAEACWFCSSSREAMKGKDRRIDTIS